MAAALRASLLLLAMWALVAMLSPAHTTNAAKSPHRLLGGLMDADFNEEGVQRALEFAISEYNKANNDKYHSRMVQLVGARKQIVSGVKYYLDMEIGRTMCTKSQPNLATCPFHDQPPLKKKVLCSFQVYTVPWENTISMVKSSCHNV
ncbi:PREDICTED: cystatin-C-like [Elephantulus edwardii]|uniref:cystatin-C-like n=1 Tax=Elephantulus edwardii TaxID=28737 RepID=UPI0003F0E2D1|nr:PREDICTED: cystatin-C-like [Elephantulus edwardii]